MMTKWLLMTLDLVLSKQRSSEVIPEVICSPSIVGKKEGSRAKNKGEPTCKLPNFLLDIYIK